MRYEAVLARKVKVKEIEKEGKKKKKKKKVKVEETLIEGVRHHEA